VKLAAEAGLDAEEVRATLASDRFAAEVRDDENAARSLGINGVPFFVFGGKYAVSGAQPAAVMLRALEQAWAHVDGDDETAPEGAACGPDGCA
jgi:predicted DsbA family dithiol-disulfide isomerase